ncbi:redoxin domain-containing protein [Cephaloticoccus capnophilus]|uniref:redoxin domain-containing protein n=1 Tax=Cephaloticoccus capnophilus TaxID=1548208 RepID=UPI0012E7B384|nr:redoxin domain-containing protein [Cephaloticoccus capnophilus]
MKLKTLISLLAASLGLASLASARVEIGAAAPDFTLTDIDGHTHRLSDYRGKTVILEWVNPECPFVVKHYESGNLPKTQEAATAEGVVWLLINSAHPEAQGDYSADEARAWQASTGAAASAYLRDPDGTVGRLYDAKTTPHLFIITADGSLAYDGAIDSIRSTRQSDIEKAENYVTSALDALRRGEPVATTVTLPYGCTIKY